MGFVKVQEGRRVKSPFSSSLKVNIHACQCILRLGENLLPSQIILANILPPPLSPIIPIRLVFLSCSIFDSGIALDTGSHSRGGDEFGVFKNGGTAK
jgi:hypothetical protein